MGFEENLEKYADLIVRAGLNIQEGDKLSIRCDEDGLPLARLVSRQAYQAGAMDVQVDFSDDRMELDFYLYAPDEALEYFPEYRTAYFEERYKDNYHLLLIETPNPDLLKNADAERIAKNKKAGGRANKRLQPYILEKRIKWNISAAVGPAWARAVFPELPEGEGIEKLWETIFYTARLNQEDPVKAWAEHDKALRSRVDFLNASAFEKLLYRGPGTDLEVHLVDGHLWHGGSSEYRGTRFFPNIPTEEIFTMPHADRVSGALKATMPLNISGQLVDNFHFTFEDGRVVDFDAETGKDILAEVLDMDEGAVRLGEAALVPHHSPISNTGLLFKSSLYDENASCHFALGAALHENLEGAKDRTEEENREIGMNNSIIHIDFMVGSEKLEVTGVQKDGTEIKLLEGGEWTS